MAITLLQGTLPDFVIRFQQSTPTSSSLIYIFGKHIKPFLGRAIWQPLLFLDFNNLFGVSLSSSFTPLMIPAHSTFYRIHCNNRIVIGRLVHKNNCSLTVNFFLCVVDKRAYISKYG